jgi:hypothetical protein
MCGSRSVMAVTGQCNELQSAATIQMKSRGGLGWIYTVKGSAKNGQ